MNTEITKKSSDGQVMAEDVPNCSVRPRMDLIGSIDQGTSSTRFLVFENLTGKLIASSQVEIERIVPKEGWVEMDPDAIMDSVYSTISNVHQQLDGTSLIVDNDCDKNRSGERLLKTIGISNQRESTVVWDSQTGKALYNVILWMDNRTKDLVDNMIDSVPGRDFNWLKEKTGLPMSPYFSAFKLKWLIDNVEQVKQALKEDRLLFGTVDSWILWNLTGRHLTDVTNASRTFLMDIENLNWDKTLCELFKIPMKILPKILSSADDFGYIQHEGPLKGLPITGVIGDQSGALFGHNCLQLGQTKATFGTGCFIMQNIGPGPLSGALRGVHRDAKRGLITTVAYRIRDRPVCYSLEGSVKIAGAAITWMRDNMQLIKNYDECDQLVNQTSNSAGVFFVPAFGGLYAPYWDPNAAGLFIGLSQFTRREHLIRATFDSIAFQTNDILSIMRGVTNGLMIDGGLCKSENMSQILADITGCHIVRPAMCETSALGAAMIAACGANLWSFESMLASSNRTNYEYSSSANQIHHYPHESLHYEDRFSSLIQSKSLSSKTNDQPMNDIDGSPNNGNPTNSDDKCHRRHQNQSQSLANLVAGDQEHQERAVKPCYLHAGGGVNDDAGGGTRQMTANSLVNAEQLTDEEDQAIAVHIAQTDDPAAKEPKTISARHAVPSSGYSSSDNYELNLNQNARSSGAGRRTDSPISSLMITSDSQATKEASQNGEQSSQVQIASSPSSGHIGQSQRRKHQSNDNAPESAPNPKRSSLSFPSNISSRLRSYICPNLPPVNQGFPYEQDLCDYDVDEDDGDYDDDDDEEDDEDDEDDSEISECEYESSSESDDRQRRLRDRHLEEPSSRKLIHRSAARRTRRGQLLRHHQQHQQQPNQISTPNENKAVDVFQSYISLEHRTELVNSWHLAVERSMQWTKVHHEEVRKIDYQRLSSLPISMYLFLSIGMVALSGIFGARFSIR